MTTQPDDVREAMAIKPCPFCGRDDSTHTDGCYFTVDDEDGDVIAAWNRRPYIDRLQDRVAELEADTACLHSLEKIAEQAEARIREAPVLVYRDGRRVALVRLDDGEPHA